MAIQSTPTEVGLSITQFRSLLALEKDSFLTGLEGSIQRQRAGGVTDEVIAQNLLTDFETGGPVFGSLKSRIDKQISGLMQDLATKEGNVVTLDQLGPDLGSNPEMWVATLIRTCSDCVALHGTIQTRDEWEASGVPNVRPTICTFKGSCYCELVDTRGMSGADIESIRKPIKLQKEKIKEYVALRKEQGVKLSKAYKTQLLGQANNPNNVIAKNAGSTAAQKATEKTVDTARQAVKTQALQGPAAGTIGAQKGAAAAEAAKKKAGTQIVGKPQDKQLAQMFDKTYYRNRLTNAELFELQEYTELGSQAINDYIRTGELSRGLIREGWTKSRITIATKQIDNAIAKAGVNYQGRLFSGVSIGPASSRGSSALKAQFIDNLKKQAAGGSGNVSIKTFISSSWDKEVAEKFATGDGILLDIKSKRAVPISGISRKPGENEVLFARNTKFKLGRITETKDGLTIIKLEEI